LSVLAVPGYSTEGLKATDQMLASRRLAPMKEQKEAAKRIDARWRDGPVLVRPVVFGAMP
jgi:hypothetical protein